MNSRTKSPLPQRISLVLSKASDSIAGHLHHRCRFNSKVNLWLRPEAETEMSRTGQKRACDLITDLISFYFNIDEAIKPSVMDGFVL